MAQKGRLQPMIGADDADNPPLWDMTLDSATFTTPTAAKATATAAIAGVGFISFKNAGTTYNILCTTNS